MYPYNELRNKTIINRLEIKFRKTGNAYDKIKVRHRTILTAVEETSRTVNTTVVGGNDNLAIAISGLNIARYFSERISQRNIYSSNSLNRDETKHNFEQ